MQVLDAISTDKRQPDRRSSPIPVSQQRSELGEPFLIANRLFAAHQPPNKIRKRESGHRWRLMILESRAKKPGVRGGPSFVSDRFGNLGGYQSSLSLVLLDWRGLVTVIRNVPHADLTSGTK